LVKNSKSQAIYILEFKIEDLKLTRLFLPPSFALRIEAISFFCSCHFASGKKRFSEQPVILIAIGTPKSFKKWTTKKDKSEFVL
jgi:hypothetical protein